MENKNSRFFFIRIIFKVKQNVLLPINFAGWVIQNKHLFLKKVLVGNIFFHNAIVIQMANLFTIYFIISS